MKKTEKFLQTKQYLTDDCKQIAKMAMDKNWETRHIVFHVTKNYSGIDCYIVLFTLMNHHYTNKGRQEILDDYDAHFWTTIERYIAEPKSDVFDYDKFFVGAIGALISIPTKY